MSTRRRLWAALVALAVITSFWAPAGAAANDPAGPPTSVEALTPAEQDRLPEATADEEPVPTAPRSSLIDGADAPVLDGPDPVTPDAAPARVDGAVTAALASDDTVAVIVRLKEQADLPALAARARAAERAAAPNDRSSARATTVVAELRDVADRSQAGVRGLLRAQEAAGTARDVRSYWVFNGFAATVSREALDALAARPEVASIELDAEISLPHVEGEPKLPAWGVERVNAARTWGDYGFTGEGVVVGIMDSGVDGGHPALAGQFRGRDGDIASSWYAATGENYPLPGDGFGHGTHVMGTILGGPPGEVVGVAPDAEWIAAKIFRDSGSTTSSIIHDGFQWMLAPGGDPAKAPDVVNNSWGSNDTNSVEFWDDVNAWVAAGIFPAFANGNAGPGPGTVGSPGSFPQSFGVGATDINDLVAGFSSRGPAFWDGVEVTKPQVSAPGVQIFSAWPRQLPEGPYYTISGTSMATPHVTGVVALLLSAKPDLSVDAIRELLTSTTQTGPQMGALPNDNYGSGIVDAYAAITAARFSGTLTGTVSGPAGPIAATLSVPALAVSTTSDAETGFYELRLKQGTWEVEVSAYGFTPATTTVTISADETVTRDIGLAAAAVHTLSGTVTSDGAPVVGATVRVLETPLAPVITGADGVFSFQIAAGTYSVAADATGYRRTRAELTVDGDETLNLVLVPITGTVAPGWREYQNNPARTGLSPEGLAASALTEEWEVDLPGQVLFASPVIADGVAYLSIDGGRLVALDLDDGATRWTFSTGTELRGTPAVVDGVVYLGGGSSGIFHALDAATGAPLWSIATGDMLTYTAPTVVGGTVYFGTGWGAGNGGWLYAADAATGAVRWKTFIGPEIYFAPAVGGGRIYAGSYDAQRFVALDATTGAEQWALTRETDSFAAMPSYADGVVYTATTNFDTGVGSMLAIDATTGDLLWEATGHGDGAGNAPVVFDQTVIAGSSTNNWVVAYDRDSGERTWVAPIGAAVSNSQLAADGVLVGGSQQDHRAWALDAYSGDLLWDETLSDNILAAPALADGRLLIVDRSGVVRAYAAPGTVSGTVTASNGAALDAEVRVADGSAVTRTDPATGEFTLDVRPGSVTVEAYAYGHAVASAELVVRSGQTTPHDFVLAPVASGSLAGTVTDAGGAPLEGVSIALPGTPLAPVQTDAAGAFAFADVAAGTYQLTAQLDGFAPLTREVTIEAGAQTVADIELLRYQIAVTGDYGAAITNLLAGSGYRVEATTAAAIADRPGDYELIVMNGAQDDPGEAAFEALVANAAAAETSIINLDTWGLSYGSIEHLKRYLGDPAVTGSGYSDGEVSLVARATHPLTASLGVGGRVPLLAPNSEYAWFDDYGGRSLADVYIGEAGRTVGSGIGYAPTSFGSAQVLLSLHAASPWSGPNLSWQPAATAVFDDAIAYALDPSYGAVAGTVTNGSGAGVAATVTVVETGDTTTAAADGTYRLLLAPGDVTLRFERIGFEPFEAPVSVVARNTATVDANLVSTGLGGIAGSVTDGGGTGIAGATVRVAGTDLVATTDTAGTYELDGVPGGTYSIEVAADGFLNRTVDGVVVVNGAVTDLDVTLRASLHVAVVGDYAGTMTAFLNANQVIATATGWEVVDDLDAYDLVIVNDPPDPGEAAFLAALDAFDAAGVSAIFTTDWTDSGGGIQLLNEHVGDPAFMDAEFGDGPVNHVPVITDHPIYDGLDASAPIQVLANGTNSAYFDDYSGITVADYEAGNRGVIGTGAAFEPRTPTSVRLLLSGLGANVFSDPSDGWTPEGQRVFLNAVAWAAEPGLAVLSGRVIDATGAGIAAHVEIVETGIDTDAAADGGYALGHTAGAFTVEVSAFGYEPQALPVTLTAGQTTSLDVELALGPVGSIAGVVTSSGEIGTAAIGDPLAGATVQVVGQPRSAVTAEDGSYALPNVEPGTYQLEVAAAGHVRRIIDDVTVTAGVVANGDVTLRVSPVVGVIDDCSQSTACAGKLTAYLTEWGYIAEDLAWTDTEHIAELDLVLANLGDFPRDDPGAAAFAAFQDAANRAHVPVVWADEFQRGSIRYLGAYEGDPTVRSEDRDEGVVSARILADHPLTAGFAVGADVPIIEDDGEHAWFNGYSGTTVASLVNDDGVVGSAIAYRGRTASSVDILLGTFGVTFYTWPPVGDSPASLWNANTERLFHNALNYALDAPPLAGEARGTVRSSAAGTAIASSVTVVETGKAYPGRAGDGTFLVPLQPGTWTLRVSAFGHDTVDRSVTVAAGTVATVDVTLPAQAAGSLAGTVTDEAGAPLAGATVTVEGTPLSTTTAADGSYRIDGIPVGDHSVLVALAGRAQVRSEVTIAAGATTTLDVTLPPSQVVAIAGDYVSSGIPRLGTFLAANGYEVRQWSWGDVQNHVGELGDVGLVILNGNGSDPTASELTTFITAADAASVPIIAAGQYGGGAFDDLRDTFSDPPTVDWDFTAGAIAYRPAVAHPIFDGFAVGEPIELVRDAAGGNQQYVWFSGYSGTELASLEAPDPGGDGLLGDGVAYSFATPTSVHLLLASLGAASYGYPGGEWTDDAEQVYLNAVAWALTASQGEIAGTVRDEAGAPIAGATVTAVEAGVSDTTAADGTYSLGVPDGTHTVEATAPGYGTTQATVIVEESGQVELDLVLERLPRGAIDGTVTDAATGDPVAEATVALSGPMSDETTTAADGTFAFDDLLPGTYTASVSVAGYLPASRAVEVVAEETATVAIELTPNDTAVLGDVDGALVDVLREGGVAAEELAWSGADDVARYDVVIVNGGDPSEAEFEAVVTAADEAGTSLIFSGTWGVTEGGIRLLERYAPDEVTVGGQGFGEGTVAITGFDAEHPLFDGLTDPSEVVAPDSYYSWLTSYVGLPLADLAVDGADPAGISVAYDYRSADSVHLLLSTMAVTGRIGPEYGWTDDGVQLMLNAVAWARDVEQPLPAAPTLTTDDPSPTTAGTVTLTGTAEYRSTVSIHRDGTVVGTAEPGRDGAFSVEVPLVEGVNDLTAVATNFAGDSPPSSVVTVIRDTTGPVLEWTPADGDGFFDATITVAGTAIDAFSPPVSLTVNGQALAVSADGSWSTSVSLELGANPITVVATDGLANVTTESRSVGYIPYAEAWQVAGDRGRGAVLAFLQIVDDTGTPTQVTSALLEAIDTDGVVADSTAMFYEESDQRYHGILDGLGRGTYTLVAHLVVDGWNVTLTGPEVRHR